MSQIINNFPITLLSPSDLTTVSPLGTDIIFVIQGGIVKTSTINNLVSASPQPFSSLTSKPTTLAGYGITNDIAIFSPLSKTGTLSSGLTIGIPQASAATNGFMASSDWIASATEGSTGITSFAGVTIASSTQFNVGAITCWFIDNTTSPLSPTKTYITFPAQNNITDVHISAGNVTYLAINSSGIIIQQTTPFTQSQIRSVIPIGATGHPNRTSILSAVTQPNFITSPVSQLFDLMQAIGPFNISGNEYISNGANVQINKTAGSIFSNGSNYLIDPTNPHNSTLTSQTPVIFFSALQNNTTVAQTSSVDTNNYDNGGVLTLIPSGKYVIHRIFLFVNGQTAMQYGQNLYSTLADAVAAIATQTFIYASTIISSALARTAIVVGQGITDLSNPANAFFQDLGKFGATSGGAVTGVTTFQATYNNSSTPQIITSMSNGALALKRGSASETDNVLTIDNGSQVVTFSVAGTGNVISNSITTRPVTLSNFTSNGSIGSSATTVDITSSIIIPQTSSGISLTIPFPTNNQAGLQLTIENTGTVYLNVGGIPIQNGTLEYFQWNGSSWNNTNASVNTAINATDPVNLAQFNAGPIGVGNIIVTSSRAFLSSDNNGTLQVQANVTFTVNSGLPVGFNCIIISTGTNTITMSPGTGSIINRQGASSWGGDGAVCTVTANAAGRLSWSANGLN